MNCAKCGAQLNDDSMFCSVCGARINDEEPQQVEEPAFVESNAPAQSAQPEYITPAQPEYNAPVQPAYTQPVQPQYNQPTYPQYQPMPVPVKTGNAGANWAGITGFVLGLISFIPVIGVVFGLPGFIISIIGIKSQKKGLAIAGLVCSIIGFILSVLEIIAFSFFITGIASVVSDPSFNQSMHEFESSLESIMMIR